MTQPFPKPRNHAEEIENARAYCCTHNCRQGRDCKHRKQHPLAWGYIIGALVSVASLMLIFTYG